MVPPPLAGPSGSGRPRCPGRQRTGPGTGGPIGGLGCVCLRSSGMRKIRSATVGQSTSTQLRRRRLSRRCSRLVWLRLSCWVRHFLYSSVSRGPCTGRGSQLGMIHAWCSARTRPRALAGASPGDSSPLPLSRPTARRVAPWTELCEGNAVLHQLPLEPSYVGRGVAACAPPFQPSLVPFSAARAPVSQRPSLSSSPSSRLLAFSL